MRNTTAKLAVASVAAALVLVAYGGGTNDATIGGAVTGLGSGLSLTMQDNNAANLTLVGNVPFTFASKVSSGAGYNVTVLNQPVGQGCVVGNGTGTVDGGGDAVTNVAVTCSYTSSVGGTVSGLAAGTSVTLASSLGPLATVAANGLFAFPGQVPAGTAYVVTVSTQPAGQTCTIANPNGTVGDNTMAPVQVQVTCV